MSNPGLSIEPLDCEAELEALRSRIYVLRSWALEIAEENTTLARRWRNGEVANMGPGMTAISNKMYSLAEAMQPAYLDDEIKALVGSASLPVIDSGGTPTATERLKEAYSLLAEAAESLGEVVYQGEVNETLKRAAIKAGIDHTREPTWIIERLGERVELLRSDLAKAERAIASYRSYAQSGLELLASDGEGY